MMRATTNRSTATHATTHTANSGCDSGTATTIDRWLLLTVMLVCAAPSQAEELLTGAAQSAKGEPLAFSLSGQSREQIIGGSLTLAERSFTVSDQSRMGLIGAKREVMSGDPYAEYAVFSSSFSEQTATGQPWVAARNSISCDQDYNSFLVIYRVAGADAIAALGDKPYGKLTEELEQAAESTVYCFITKPPA